MLRINETGLSKRRLIRLWSCLLGGLVLASAVGAGQPLTADSDELEKHGAAVPTTYRVINLRPANERIGALQPVFNARDQVAFFTDPTDMPGSSHGWFYDGTSVVDIGYLNVQSTIVAGLNNAGQVAGSSRIGGPGEIYHAFVWSKGSGMRDLGTLGGGGSSDARAINNLGQVVGDASAPDGTTHAFRWSASEGMVDIGLLASRPDSTTVATAINDAGKVAGVGTTADGNYHAFLWTRQKGLTDLGTLGGSTSIGRAIGAEGQVAGDSTVRGLSPYHVFIWSRASGMQDLGTAGGTEAFTRGMSANGAPIRNDVILQRQQACVLLDPGERHG